MYINSNAYCHAIFKKYITVMILKDYNIETKKAKLSHNEIEEDSFDMVTKYGRCNVQPTNDTDNTFPAIAQGLAKKHKRAEK